MDLDYHTMALLLAASSAGYMYRDVLAAKITDWTLWSIDKCVEIKWWGIAQLRALRNPTSPAPVASSSSSTIVYGDYNLYSYRNVMYITPFTPLPASDIDQSFDGETIVDIIVYNTTTESESKSSKSAAPPHIKDLIVALAGPLCDFHGQVPKLEKLQKMGICGNISKIIVSTDCLREFVIS